MSATCAETATVRGIPLRCDRTAGHGDPAQMDGLGEPTHYDFHQDADWNEWPNGNVSVAFRNVGGAA